MSKKSPRQVATIALFVAAMTATAAPIAHAAQAVKRTEVCFTVHNAGDPIASTVRGTLFNTRAYTANSTVLLLQHGGVAERSAWDGGKPTVKGVPSMARRLARAGYGVFAIDRLGYAGSPYHRPPGSGWLLTPDGYIEMTHEIVTQIRAGRFRRSKPDANCANGRQPRHGAANVVLSGFSSGAALTEAYAARYHDIDGIIPMGWSNQPVASAAAQRLVSEIFLPQWLQGKDYIEFFTDGADGYSEFCEEFLFYRPGVKPTTLRQFCGPEYYAETKWPTPSGEAGVLVARNVATVGLVGPTPVLLVFADHDVLFPTAPYKGSDPDVVAPEIAMWRSRCNCDVSVYMQPDAGHANWLHGSMPQLVAEMVTWLRARGL